MQRRVPSRAYCLWAVAALTACSNDRPTGPAPSPIGDYELALVSGVRVPATVSFDGFVPIRYERGSLVMRADSVFDMTVDMYDPPSQIQLSGGRLVGTFHWMPAKRALVMESLTPAYEFPGTAAVDTIRLNPSGKLPGAREDWQYTFVRGRD